MEAFFVVGIGPGDPDYLIPRARAVIEDSHTLVGAPRHLALFRGLGKEEVVLTGSFPGAFERIRRRAPEERISVLVSGDPGLYSLLGLISAQFPRQEYRVIPGVSSVQLAAAQTGRPWQEDRVINIHGRPLEDLEPVLAESRRSFVLTDRENSPARAARWLMERGAGDRAVTIAERLSYADERVTETSLVELSRGEESEEKSPSKEKPWRADLCVMIIEGACTASG